MLSEIWQRVSSALRRGLGWAAENWAIRSLGGIARNAVNEVADIIGEPVADLITFLADAIDGLVRLVLTPIRKAWDFFGVRFAGFFTGIKDLAGGVFTGIQAIIRVIIPRVRRWLVTRIRQVRDGLRGLITVLRRWVTNKISALWRWVRSLKRWVIDRVLRPLWERVTGVIRWATEKISALWRWVRSLKQWVIDRVLRPLWEWVSNLWELVRTRIMTAVRIVEKVMSTLLAIVRYGPAKILELLLPGRLGDLAARLLRSTQGSVVETVGAIDDAADRMLRL